MSQCSFSPNYRFSWQCSQPVCSLVLTRGSTIPFFLHQPVYTKPFPILKLSWSGCGHKKGWTHLRKGQFSASQVTPEVQDTEVRFPRGPASQSSASQRKERMSHSGNTRKARRQQHCGSLLVLQAHWTHCHKSPSIMPQDHNRGNRAPDLCRRNQICFPCSWLPCHVDTCPAGGHLQSWQQTEGP